MKKKKGDNKINNNNFLMGKEIATPQEKFKKKQDLSKKSLSQKANKCACSMKQITFYEITDKYIRWFTPDFIW